ncbi:hypothetical protein MNR01_12590 [Lysobacter sp. S4-A87]|uniref:hypothetical protein n=1 Tax=Lysobacter sp. S4-A87 TaxID=2925843 RepID=UPI001F52CC66|nr:hypothetical protein [Lysobacter sp. S4-A87]UNK48583.1 hypothetical protein MNR01_12590 [Lysobacter sp. S4-A87]
MNLPMELLLVVGVFALYLQDSMLLLHYDEVVLERSGWRWRASTGSGFELAGRRLYLPDPWRPGSAMFRLTWLGDGAPAPQGHWAALNHFVAALDALKGGCRLLWVLMLVALPLLLWRFPHPVVLLALAAAVYATGGWLVVQLWRYRRVFGLSTREVGSIGFEALCCPPHAINLVRRLTLRRGLRGNAIDVASQVLDRDGATRIGQAIGARMAVALDFAEGDERLLQARQRLEVLR